MYLPTYLQTYHLCFFVAVIPALVTSITISSNGNSPEIKMVGGMMVDVQKGFTPMASNRHETIVPHYEKSRRFINNSTKLSLNERYRRLIPYMTFYYANDLVSPTTEAYNAKNVEVQKAEIIEATTIGHTGERQPKKIVYTSHRNIPRYHGNRLTQYNIASANPTKILYKVPVYSNSPKVTTHYNPLLSVQDYDYERLPQKQIVKAPSVPFAVPVRKPYVNLYNNNDDTANIRYYLSETEHVPKFKLVPYEQTPPVQVLTQNDNFYEAPKKSVPVIIPKEQVYIKPRPISPQVIYDNVNIQQLTGRKQPVTVSENYYEKRPRPVLAQPIIESGFKPISNAPVTTTEAPAAVLPESEFPYFESEKHQPQLYETSTLGPEVDNLRPNYYQYVQEPVTYKPTQDHYKTIVDTPILRPALHSPANSITLGDLINSLQLNKSIPNPITRENVGSSIRTLLQVLNALKAVPQQNEVENPKLSTPEPYISPEEVVDVTQKPVIEINSTPTPEDEELHEEPYLAPVKTPSQHLDGE